MFANFFDWAKKKPTELTLEQVKKITRVLMIDDNEPEEIKGHLEKEGWKVSWIPDLDALSNKTLKACHIVCLDIMGVGKLLRLESGMGLVKTIKSKYPEKKIILYSSVSHQDIFDDSVDIVDKRLRKEISPLPFSAAVEELAIKTLNWEDAAKLAYSKILPIVGKEISYDDFKKGVLKSIGTGGLDLDKLQKYAKVTSSIASVVAPFFKLVVLK